MDGLDPVCLLVLAAFAIGLPNDLPRLSGRTALPGVAQGSDRKPMRIAQLQER